MSDLLNDLKDHSHIFLNKSFEVSESKFKTLFQKEVIEILIKEYQRIYGKTTCDLRIRAMLKDCAYYNQRQYARLSDVPKSTVHEFLKVRNDFIEFKGKKYYKFY